ncbi:MAG: RuBisCO accumulation factor 1 [Nostocaceae cyanobacterium]|nr:RuBisCO accumulation factor 1 [Nostocaceae cyanobacterium]
MTQLPPNTPNPDNAASEDVASGLLQKLRHKQGSWVEWGQACAQLQKAGYSSQTIFEATGFEPVHQNQVIVGSQVYSSLETSGAPETVRSHFAKKGSDILYEFRLLSGGERAAAAELILALKLDADDARDVAKAIKEFSRFRNLPPGFSNHPGDAVAYQCWKLARQNSDFQQRSRLIAKGLKFAQSTEARQQIEQLLVDFTVVPKRPAPTLPFYRPDSEEELPRLLPVAGKLPLTAKDLQAVPILEESGPFRMVKFAGEQAWVAVPGWRVILAATDPVGILTHSDRLPNYTSTNPEPVLVVVDRAGRQWDSNSYFIVENAGELDIQWFETAPDIALLGRVVVIVRPKRIVDEELTKDSWQIDE